VCLPEAYRLWRVSRIAGEAVGDAGAAHSVRGYSRHMALSDGKYIRVTTFKKSDRGVVVTVSE